jgi:hypothetical protein
VGVRTNFKAVLERVRSAVITDPVKPEELQKLGDETIKMIQVRTRLGYGVDKVGAQRKKLKPLSEAYIEMRRKNKKLSSFTNARRSNLTLYGYMLESLSVVIRKRAILIEPTGARPDGESNQGVAQSVTRSGRPFISLSDLEIKKLKRFYQNEILGKALRKRGLT